MSEDDLAVLAKFGEAFSRRSFDGIFPYLHEEFEFHEPPEQLGATVFKGAAECREGFAKWAGTWVELRSEVKGFEVLPDGRVLVYSREHMLGRDGLRVENDAASIFTFRDGKVLRWQVFWDPANARAAAGV